VNARWSPADPFEFVCAGIDGTLFMEGLRLCDHRDQMGSDFFSLVSCSRLIPAAPDRKIGNRSTGGQKSASWGKAAIDWLKPRELHPCGLFWA
jgi:hypothetical protein